MSSSCFIRPEGFNKNSLSLFLKNEIFKTGEDENENNNNKSLNLNSPTLFYDTNSYLNPDMNGEDSKFCFISFYTKSELWQKTQMNNINKEWENLNNKANPKDAGPCENSDDDDINVFDTVIFNPNVKPKQKHDRAPMNDFNRSIIIPINDKSNSNQDFDSDIVEEEEEHESDSKNYNFTYFNDYDEVDDDDDNIQVSRAGERYENNIQQ